MTRRVPLRHRFVVAGALTAFLAGCSAGDSEPVGKAPKPSQSSRFAPSPAAAPTYSPPTVAPPPVSASSPDTTRAAIFALAWFETLNYGFATGDADPLRQSISLGCFTCANWVIEVQTQADRNLRREGGHVHVRDLVFVGPSGDDFVFRAVLNRDGGELIAPDGGRTAVVESTGEEVDLSVGLSSSSLTGTTAWSMKGITAPSG